jgi:hypothetical protein
MILNKDALPKYVLVPILAITLMIATLLGQDANIPNAEGLAFMIDPVTGEHIELSPEQIIEMQPRIREAIEAGNYIQRSGIGNHPDPGEFSLDGNSLGLLLGEGESPGDFSKRVQKQLNNSRVNSGLRGNAEDYRKLLEVNNDDEWAIIKLRLEAVLSLIGKPRLLASGQRMSLKREINRDGNVG